MTTLSTAARNAACNAVAALLDGGDVQLQTAASAAVATLALANPAFGAAANGVATAGAISEDPSAAAGTVAKAVLRDSVGAEIMTLTVTLPGGGGDVELSSLQFSAGDAARLTSLTYTQPAG